MKISPRISGTMGFSRNLGINFPILTLMDAWNYDIEIINNENEILLDRAFCSKYKTNIEYSHIYVDDDTIEIDSKVNIMLLAFLYYAKNQGKIVHILTKYVHYIWDKGTVLLS